MTLVEFKRILDEAGYPVTYSHFSSPPQLPYLVYLEAFNPSFDADNKTYHKMADVQVELYSIKKDLNAEGKLEGVFDKYEIPYTSTGQYIQSENLYQKLYEVRLI
ncbi:hypothetical protein LC048_13570 [Mesobacillus subterraneus]|uniref:hypothetical protein n=1 Tax=Mesobacillus subterraneus TaxID=285983 RepID=UPI001CFE9B78|nr:hypothetical protein [Mesobacillus subterraneus]WLR53552.1 hypothetical protein LC048_13570 [Mesobacillus subterraneus]